MDIPGVKTGQHIYIINYYIITVLWNCNCALTTFITLCGDYKKTIKFFFCLRGILLYFIKRGGRDCNSEER